MATRRRAEPAQRVRIVGGSWKRTPLRVPEVRGLRPTPDRVRETLFNWLGQSLAGLRVLDAFAGTGVLGLEAASRGAARVLMIERDPAAVAAIRETVARLDARQVELVRADALAELDRRASSGERFDLAFVDPPYGQQLVERTLARLRPLLAPGARVYVESEAALARQPGFHVVRADRAGMVHYHLLMHDEDTQAQDGSRPVDEGGAA
jgi:16S rRNA (guanine(966)-N(2))-methyltransferase RsmD